jgi:hypothetical protein
MLEKILEYKTNEDEMHIAVIEYMSEEDMEKLAEEIAQFDAL